MLNWTFEGLRPIANFTNGDSLIGRSIKDGVHMTHSHRMGFKFPKKNLIAIQIDKVELEDAGVYLAKGIHIRHETYLLVVQGKRVPNDIYHYMVAPPVIETYVHQISYPKAFYDQHNEPTSEIKSIYNLYGFYREVLRTFRVVDEVL